MILLPISTGWLILIVAVAVVALAVFGAVEGAHAYTWAYRKDMKAREQNLLDGWQRLFSEKEKWYEYRAQQKRQSEEDARRLMAAVRKRGLELGRAAHDASTQTKLAVHQAMDDTMPAMPRFEDSE